MSLNRYHLGCPIWGNKEWVGELFSAGARPADFLREYASVFNTVEGNTTFYGLPSQETVGRWRSDTPPGFRFCFKFPRTISHERRLIDAGDLAERFLDLLGPLDDRLGPFFLQLPPSFGPRELPALGRFLEGLPPGLQYAVEVRHADFFGRAEAEFDALLGEYKTDRVIFDTRGLHADPGRDDPGQAARRKKPRVPVRFTATGDCPFVRFVGHPKVEDNLPLLAEWAPVVAGWISEGRTPFVFMHAPDDFYAPRLARHFHRLLSTHADVGALPGWPAEQAGDEPDQLSLF